jgi:hypothetical protein
MAGIQNTGVRSEGIANRTMHVKLLPDSCILTPVF